MPRSLSTSSLSCGPRPVSAISQFPHHTVRHEMTSGRRYQKLFIVPRLRYSSGQLQQPVAERALPMIDMRHDAEVAVPRDRDGANAALYGRRVHERCVYATGRLAQPSPSPRVEGSARGRQTRPGGRRASGPEGVPRRCPRGLRPEERPGGSNGGWRGDHLICHVRSASIVRGCFASVSGFVRTSKNNSA